MTQPNNTPPPEQQAEQALNDAVMAQLHERHTQFEEALVGIVGAAGLLLMSGYPYAVAAEKVAIKIQDEIAKMPEGSRMETVTSLIGYAAVTIAEMGYNALGISHLRGPQ